MWLKHVKGGKLLGGVRSLDCSEPSTSWQGGCILFEVQSEVIESLCRKLHDLNIIFKLVTEWRTHSQEARLRHMKTG